MLWVPAFAGMTEAGSAGKWPEGNMYTIVTPDSIRGP